MRVLRGTKTIARLPRQWLRLLVVQCGLGQADEGSWRPDAQTPVVGMPTPTKWSRRERVSTRRQRAQFPSASQINRGYHAHKAPSDWDVANGAPGCVWRLPGDSRLISKLVTDANLGIGNVVRSPPLGSTSGYPRN